MAVATFVAGAFAGGRFAWLQIGFLYGSEHYPYLFISSTYNLPFLLDRLGWSAGRTARFDLRFDGNPNRFAPLA